MKSVVVIGATREASTDFDASTAGYPTAGGMAQVLGEGMLLVPALRDARWIGPRVGFRPTRTDDSGELPPRSVKAGL